MEGLHARTVVRLQKSWRYSPAPGGVELFSVIHGRRLLVRDDPQELRAALDLLDEGVPEPRSVRRICEATGWIAAKATQFLDRLRAEEVVITVQESPAHLFETKTEADSLFDRQVRFFDFFETEDKSAEMLNRTLQGRRVLVVGMGGYGTHIASELARIGVRCIVGIDPDTVEQSNLSRQVLFGPGDVGSKKVFAARDQIDRLSSRAVEFVPVDDSIETPDDLIPYLEGVDLVFNPFGYPVSDSLLCVAEAAGKAGIPHLLLGGSWVGPLTIPGHTACYWCLSREPKVSHLIQASHGDWLNPSTHRPLGGVFSPRVAITTGVAVWEAARFLSGCDQPPTLNGVVTLDLLNYTGAPFFPVRRDPECSACGGWTLTTEGNRTDS